MPTGIKVNDVMIEKVIIASPEDTIQQAAQLMSKNDVGLLVICEENKPVGIVTREDIVDKIIQHNKPITSSIREIMRTPVISCSPNEDLSNVAQVMLKYGFKRLPVISDNKLVGLISYREIIKTTPEEISTLREQLLKDEPIFYPKKRGPGSCELCENYAEDLKNQNGKWVCTTCLETSSEMD